MKRVGLASIMLGVAMAACGHSRRASTTSPPADGAFSSTSVCTAVGATEDLAGALRGETTPGSTRGSLALARIDEELAYLHEAREGLRGSADPKAVALDKTLASLDAELTSRRTDVAGAMKDLQQSHTESQELIAAARRCDRMDLADDPEDRGGRCREARRLWSAIDDLDLTSAVETEAVAGHIKAFVLTGERAALRDQLSQWLSVHSGRLSLSHDAFRRTTGESDHFDLRERALEALVQTRNECITQLPAPPKHAGATKAPRQATVVVRPIWPGDEAAAREQFGSGFVIRWRGTDGAVQTRIVTNEHVVAGASSAEIVVDDPAGHGGDHVAPIRATLLRAIPNDDIAILAVGPEHAARLGAGVGFRGGPVLEQERVVAAGFPGLRGEPSFQVTEGVISNARFGATEHDVDGVDALLQHTAAIDPGNSGGPLLDGDGRLLGMNTYKIGERENMGLAVPSSRIRLAMIRANARPQRNASHALAACALVAAALTKDEPTGDDLDRFGVALGQPRDNERTGRASEAATATDPAHRARDRSYRAAKAAIEIRPYALCSDAHAEGDGFVATVPTTNGDRRLKFTEELGALRLSEIQTGVAPTRQRTR